MYLASRLFPTFSIKCKALVFTAIITLLSVFNTAHANEKVPIVILPTALMPHALYLPMQFTFFLNANSVSYLPLPNAGAGSFVEQAQALSEHIDDILLTTGAQQVNIVAHSSGAIAARYYIKFLAGDAKVNHLVSIASAHHGALATTLYNIFIPDICKANPACTELVIGGNFLTALNAGDESWGDVSYTSLMTSPDIFVPNWSSQQEGANNILIQNICPSLELEHFTMVLNGHVAIGIMQALAQEEIDFACP